MAFTVIDELSKGIFHPIYVIYGEEQYLIENIIGKMKQTMLDPDWSDMNLTIIDLHKQPLEHAIEEADSFPFGEGRRLIVAQNAFFLTGNTPKGSIDHSPDALLTYVQQPTDFSTLVLVVPYNKLDERKKVVKTLLSHSRVVHAGMLSPKDWEYWIRKRVKEKGIPLQEETIEMLLRYLPNQLQIVENELEKLSLYVHSMHISKLTPEEVLKIISRSTEGDLFDLIEKIANRKFQAAFEVYNQLIKQNEEPVKMIALLARQFRIILLSKVMNQQGYSQKQIAAQLKMHPYPIKLAIEQGKKFTESGLCTIIDRIAELDYEIKTGKVDRYLGLEMLLLFIQSSRGKASMIKK